MNTFQKSIMYDRYSMKVEHRPAQSSDTVIATIDGRRLPATVAVTTDQYAYVILENGQAELVAKNDYDIVLETEPEHIWKRLAKTVSNDYKEFKQFYDLFQDWKFVPAGRILANLGTGTNESYYNCFVLPSPIDSRQGILSTLSQMVEIMSRGGGVGINLSSLRPKNARVRGVNGKSSGAVSWGKIYSDTTGLIIQGGSRRGALMLMLDVEHPDLLEFINAKKTPGQYTNCNMSVVVSDRFMEAVKNDEIWDFSFPDTTDPEYVNWTGDRTNYKGKFITYPGQSAKAIWNTIMESAWSSGEPGVWFRDRANAASYAKDRLIATNPCGEQGLPAWGVCNLGAINLGQFYDPEEKVNWTKLWDAVQLGVQFLDRIIDKNVYTFEENKRQQLKERRVGLNFMGLADLLVKVGLRYGSVEAVVFCDELFDFIKNAAYWQSSLLAEKYGPYPDYSFESYKDSPFFNSLEPSTKERIEMHGLRNATLLTAAPTGTTGTMVGASTGIEPYFALEWTRNSRLGSFTERVSTLEGVDLANLPDYFVTAQELTPEEHIYMQAIIQKHVDASISKTINLPSSTTVTGVAEVYQMLYDSGCKGGTIYRDQSRSEQVLQLTTPKGEIVDVELSVHKNENVCPKCGENSLVKESGCITCSNCGYSYCTL